MLVYCKPEWLPISHPFASDDEVVENAVGDSVPGSLGQKAPQRLRCWERGKHGE